ncbi:hypothetical protein L1W98_18640, partial [Acinetobacter baumannii]|nr:hypothetical protein [Acinetobacter baumannii]
MSLNKKELPSLKLTSIQEVREVNVYRKLLRQSTCLKKKFGEFKHEVRQFQKPYDNQQAEQISLMV